MTAHELDIARQLVALAPLLRGDRYHCHFVLRPALFEAAVGLADLLRPELGEDVHIPLFEGIDDDGRPYKASLCLDNETRYNRRHADCSHNNCCPSVDRGGGELDGEGNRREQGRDGRTRPGDHHDELIRG